MRDYEKRQVEELNLTTQLAIAQKDGTPRYHRALRFSHEIMHLMRDYIPADRDIRARIYDDLLRRGFEANAEIICVPHECDALDKAALERRRLELSMQPVRVAPILTVAEETKLP